MKRKSIFIFLIVVAGAMLGYLTLVSRTNPFGSSAERVEDGDSRNDSAIEGPGAAGRSVEGGDRHSRLSRQESVKVEEVTDVVKENSGDSKAPGDIAHHTLHFNVVDPDGRPVRGANVSVRKLTPERRAPEGRKGMPEVTGIHGEVELAIPTKDLNYGTIQVTVFHNSHPTRRIHFRAEEVLGISEFEVALRRGTTLRGSVNGVASEDLADDLRFKVIAMSDSSSEWLHETVLTNSGTFEIEMVPELPIYIHVKDTRSEYWGAAAGCLPPLERAVEFRMEHRGPGGHLVFKGEEAFLRRATLVVYRMSDLEQMWSIPNFGRDRKSIYLPEGRFFIFLYAEGKYWGRGAGYSGECQVVLDREIEIDVEAGPLASCLVRFADVASEDVHVRVYAEQQTDSGVYLTYKAIDVWEDREDGQRATVDGRINGVYPESRIRVEHEGATYFEMQIGTQETITIPKPPPVNRTHGDREPPNPR